VSDLTAAPALSLVGRRRLAMFDLERNLMGRHSLSPLTSCASSSPSSTSATAARRVKALNSP